MDKSARIAGRALLLIVVGGLIAACNLGAQAPVEAPSPTPPLAAPQALTPTITVTPLIINVTPTVSPAPQLLPAETLGPITIDGTSHRTDEVVKVHVMVGKSVSAVTCSYVLQDTGQTTILGSPTTTQIDENVSENVYTFTPAAAGTYEVSCTGIALTVSGQRMTPPATSVPFAVEAKG